MHADGGESWHAREAAEAIADFGCSPQGIGEAEAARRLAEYGLNRLTPPPPRSVLLRFLSQFDNLLIY